MEDICLVGFGAIGALYAFALEQSSQARVTVVCRSNYDAVSANGLEVESNKLGNKKWRPYRVMRSLEAAADRKYTSIVCAFKCYLDIQATSSILEPLLRGLRESPETSIVLLQNGIGIEDELMGTLTSRNLSNTVISGCAWVDTTMIDGRKVVQPGNELLILGYHRPKSGDFSENKAQTALDTLHKLLCAGGANAELAENIDAARWRKVLWNASYSTLCTLARCRVCDVLAVPQSRAALQSVMLEVLRVARACLPPEEAALLSDSFIPELISKENPESTFKPSMLVDLEAGRPIEVEAIIGGIVRRAKEVKVSIPQIEIIYASLLVVQRRIVARIQ